MKPWQVFLFLITLVVVACAPQTPIKPPVAADGFLDLSTWDFEKNGSARLSGDWEIYWGQLLTPADLHGSSLIKPTGYFTVPQSWNDLTVGNMKLPATGYATFRVRIRISYQEQPFAVYLKAEKMAWRAWINGKEVASAGVVGTNASNSKPANQTARANFILQPGNDIELVLQVSNFHYSIGGLRNEMLIGPANRINRDSSLLIGLDAFLFGVFVAIAIYHISLYILNPGNIAPLSVTFFTLGMGLWRLMQGELAFTFYLPMLSGEAVIQLELLCAFSLPISMGVFVKALFPKEWPGWYSWVVGISFVPLLISAPLLPLLWTSQSLIFFRFAIVGNGLIFMGIILRAALHKRYGATEILTVVMMIVGTALLDTIQVLQNQTSALTDILFPLGFVSMAVVQAFLLARRSAQDHRTVQAQKEHLAQLNAGYYRFVPQAFLHLLGKKDFSEIKLGDQVEQKMAIMFLDIRGFTAISEHMSPAQVFHYLNDVMGGIAPIIRNHNGFIDKFIGDGFMALFPGTPQDAMQAGIEIRHYLSGLNEKRSKNQERPLNISLAIHVGHIMFGTVGEPERMDGTVVADAVNTTSRMEDLAKRSGVAFLISEKVYEAIPAHAYPNIRRLGEVALRGREENIVVYDVFDGDPPELAHLKQTTRANFEEGLRLFQAGEFARAQALFDLVMMTNPEDSLATYYWTMSDYFATHGVPRHWDGVSISTQ